MNKPLAYKLRPTSIKEIVGQEHLLSNNGFIKRLIDNKKILSMIFYGNPGTGKTTTAIALCEELKLNYQILNATINNKKDIEECLEIAKKEGHLVVIMDEVHRLNKDKQDYLLPYIESGLITLIGATTANPYHSINPAIRSRCHLLEFKPLSKDNIKTILINACKSKDGLEGKFSLTEASLDIIARMSNGDVRYALNQLEIASLTTNNNVINEDVINSITKIPQYMIDNDSDGHYDAVSALQKSIRGSDVDAALYYLARLIAANDLESIERRLSITAYEDIGLANPNAVSRTITAIQVAKNVGFPEGCIPLGVAVVDLCLSPKSKSGCLSIENALEFVQNNPLPVPEYLRFTPVGLKEDEKYPYDRSDLRNKIQYLPEQIKNMRFYEPNENSQYEKALVDNYNKLKQINRSPNIKELRK